MAEVVAQNKIKVILEKLTGDVQKSVEVANPPEVDKPIESKVEAPKVPVFTEDSWMYSKDIEPKIFKEGEEIPDESWSHKNKWHWYKDSKNNFVWRKK